LLNLRKNIFVKIILHPLSILYGMITDFRNWLFDKGILKQSSSSVPVISVGNITAGGTGKTPFVMFLIESLSDQFTKIVVVSRGYGRRSKGLKIVSDGTKILMPVEESGDEPYLIARKYSSVPVIVSERRSVGIEEAVNRFDADIVLLDDAFQHRRAHRHCDIVLVNSQTNIEMEQVLPLGNLRENLKHLRRADIVVFTGSESNEVRRIRYDNLNIGSENIFNCLFKVAGIVDADLKPVGELTVLAGQRCVAFAAIANPIQFQKTLEANNIQVDKFIAFPDHHFYSRKDHFRLIHALQRYQSDYLITTEKDLVRVNKSHLRGIKVVGIRRKGMIPNIEKFKNKLQEFVDFKL